MIEFGFKSSFSLRMRTPKPNSEPKSSRCDPRLAWLSLKKTIKDAEAPEDINSNCLIMFTMIVCALPVFGIVFVFVFLLLVTFFITLTSLSAQLVNLFYDFGCQFKFMVPGLYNSNWQDDKEGKCLLIGLGSIVGMIVVTLCLIGLFCIFKTSKRNYQEMMKKVDA